MSKRYKIKYLPIAQEDLFEIVDYIRKDNPKAAEAFIDKFESEIIKLKTFPELGVIPRDDRLKMLGYRMLVIDNYLVFYILRKTTVEIRRVIHGKRKYQFLLE